MLLIDVLLMFCLCRYNVRQEGEEDFRRLWSLCSSLSFCYIRSTVWATGEVADSTLNLLEAGFMSARDALYISG